MYINLAKKLVAVQPKAGHTVDVDRVKAEITEAGHDVVKVDTVSQTVALLLFALGAWFAFVMPMLFE